MRSSEAMGGGLGRASVAGAALWAGPVLGGLIYDDGTPATSSDNAAFNSTCPATPTTQTSAAPTGPAPPAKSPVQAVSPVPCTSGCASKAGMPSWHVIEPEMNLGLEDTPFLYKASRGPDVTFRLYYKDLQGPQNAADNGQAAIFSVGRHWHTPWRCYLEAVPGQSTNFWLYAGDGSATFRSLNLVDYRTRSRLIQVASTNVLEFADGSRRVFGFRNTMAGVTRYFQKRGQALG